VAARVTQLFLISTWPADEILAALEAIEACLDYPNLAPDMCAPHARVNTLRRGGKRGVRAHPVPRPRRCQWLIEAVTLIIGYLQNQPSDESLSTQIARNLHPEPAMREIAEAVLSRWKRRGSLLSDSFACACTLTITEPAGAKLPCCNCCNCLGPGRPSC